MLSKIKSKTLQNLLKVLSGNIVAQGIGFLTIIIISRDLGSEQYGIFSLLIAIFTIAVQVSDFGISTSYIKYLSENLNKSKEIFFTVLVSKIILSILVMTVLYLVSFHLSLFFFDTHHYSKLIEFIAISILFHSLMSVIVSQYQAKQKFKEYAYINIVHNTIKISTIMMISLLFSQEFHLDYFIYAYVFSLIGILIFLLIINFKNIILKNSFDFNHFIQIYKLGFWIFLSSLATMIIMRLDIMMLQKMSTAQEVGYYSVAMNLAMIFPLITASLTTTLLPKMDQFLQNNSIEEYISKILSKAKYAIFILILLEILSPFVIGLLFGIEYKDSVSVFQILIVAFIFGVIINPIALVIYSINKAYILTLLNWIQLPLNYFGNMYLIPLLQADGAAISTVLLRIMGSLYIMSYLLKVRNDKKN